MQTLLYVFTIIIIGYKYQRPPALPPNHVNRQTLLDEIATKLLQANIEPDKYETTLTLTGTGGFGKTTTAMSLCHHPLIKKQFTDGFIFIDLGPQATDPSVKLSRFYHLLTGEDLKQGDISYVEQEMKQLTHAYYRNLLVIIDDVWHIEDAEPLVKAFSNCKTVLTTRMNNIEQYLPSKNLVPIGPMTAKEAISLLTIGVIDSSQLPEEDISLLDELAEDVHLWPLLLSLVRGHLSHNLKQYNFTFHKAIQNVQAKLHQKGLTAFDKNNIDITKANKSRKFAVKACIEMTLELIEKSISDKLKSLILWTGIGTSLQTEALNNLWHISEQEAKDTVDVLWAYGLVQFTNITISPNSITQHCVEVHTVISQYIVECMDSNEMTILSPISSVGLNTYESVIDKLDTIYHLSYGIHDPSSLTTVDFLKYRLSHIENSKLPWFLKSISMCTVIDPHQLIIQLQHIKAALRSSQYSANLFPYFARDLESLEDDCKNILKDAHKVCRKLNQSIQKNLFKKNYDNLIQTVEEYVKIYPLCNVAQRAITMVAKIQQYCNGKLLDYMTEKYDYIQTKTPDYHCLSNIIFPYIMFEIKTHKKISHALLMGSPDIELTYHYFRSGKFDQEMKSVYYNSNFRKTNYFCR